MIMNNETKDFADETMKKSNKKNQTYLLQPATSTNLIYVVSGLTDDEIENINSLNRHNIILNRIKVLRTSGVKLKFVGMKNPIFEDNLRLIKPDFPEYLSELIKMYYFDGVSSCQESLDSAVYWGLITDKDRASYKQAFIRFLEAVDSGMRPYIPWDGTINSENGSYLWHKTKFARGDTSRLKFMEFYRENGKTYIKLNFGIVIKE